MKARQHRNLGLSDQELEAQLGVPMARWLECRAGFGEMLRMCSQLNLWPEETRSMRQGIHNLAAVSALLLRTPAA